ncbi:HVA22-like protein a [Andrographis paniculata]|uniref:HVA22-like protein a n=1 Tax=Andrographis paniculata TaxID=175694 RepID=UPI0021E859A1|nr:HVA22-like protein a [Andrographis paniculata]
MGGSGENVFTLLAKNIDVLAMPLVSLVFPLYCSVKAIETKSLADDQQWLTYWVLYSLITLFELTFAKILDWFPIWSYAKLVGVCWLVLPYFNGAAYVYEHFVRPLYRNPPRQVKLWYVPRKKDDVFSKPDDVLAAAEKYIEENGPQAFERMIAKADREARARRSSYTVFHDLHDYDYHY